MSVITLQDIIPPPRHDDIPWTKLILQEAGASTGPWVTIETLTLAPLDADPANPNARGITSENATLDEGWYRVFFEDADADQSTPTNPVQNKDEAFPTFTPSIGSVGALLHARTKDTNGNELGTFTSETRPTNTQVAQIIGTAVHNVGTALKGTIPAEWLPEAAEIAALKAAMLVELSFFPEQIRTGRSPYTEYKDLYDQKIQLIQEALLVAEPDPGQPSQGEPQWFFHPDRVPIGGVRW